MGTLLTKLTSLLPASPDLWSGSLQPLELQLVSVPHIPLFSDEAQTECVKSERAVDQIGRPLSGSLKRSLFTNLGEAKDQRFCVSPVS
jgi:hypothetical protein